MKKSCLYGYLLKIYYIDLTEKKTVGTAMKLPANYQHSWHITENRYFEVNFGGYVTFLYISIFKNMIHSKY